MVSKCRAWSEERSPAGPYALRSYGEKNENVSRQQASCMMQEACSFWVLFTAFAREREGRRSRSFFTVDAHSVVDP